jgi:hypothetical protein
MPFVHGKVAHVEMDDDQGALFDLSPYANEVDYPVSIDTAETSHFGSQPKTYLAGLDDATVSIKGMFDATIDQKIAASVANALATNETITVEIGPAGTATGSPKYTMECVPTGYEVDAPVGDVVTFSLDLQRTGATTRSTYA